MSPKAQSVDLFRSSEPDVVEKAQCPAIDVADPVGGSAHLPQVQEIIMDLLAAHLLGRSTQGRLTTTYQEF